MKKFTKHEARPLPALPRGEMASGPIAYLDIETTGLSAHDSQVTVVGLVFAHRGGRTLEQYFVESPGDEAVVLRTVRRALRRFSGFVTYNGQGFDFPYLRVRASEHGLPWSWLDGLDLLRVARQWNRSAGELDNCRLDAVWSD